MSTRMLTLPTSWRGASPSAHARQQLLRCALLTLLLMLTAVAVGRTQ